MKKTLIGSIKTKKCETTLKSMAKLENKVKKESSGGARL